MNSAEIRNIFLRYFKKNNHEIVHSSPLVPQNDPSLMFTNSGMVQFKNIFTGKEVRNYSRAVTSQKCVRAGGKHNDLENVGYTARHHTFFEMLGNFSFGDYFKDQAIEFAWNLITKELKIDKKKLLVTVYHHDEEAFNLWKKIGGLSDENIIKISTSDNFWSMGDTGPCGPCSEIFYDHGDKFFGGPPGSKDEDGDRFIEIWNLVFMQYEQVSKNERKNLPKPSIDTGMGLERVAALLQNTNDNYETDIFKSLINKSIELSNNQELKNLSSHKVIADHLRSAAFLISDGVLPSNEGRGYVLRRIMRRGMRHAHSLGNKDPIFHKIFPTLLSNMKDAYPELERAKDLILNTLLNEESKFKQTIDNGLKILEDEIKNTLNTNFSGEIAFKLYDTYGFPLDLTQDYLKNRNIKVDVKTFDSSMLKQKSRARKNWKGTGDVNDSQIWYEFVKKINNTNFIGYDQNKTESIVQNIIVNEKKVRTIRVGDKVSVLLNQTPFYGESGGQVGDQGFLYNENLKIRIDNTIKFFDNYLIHFGEVILGECNVGDQVTASVDLERKKLIRNNHSATHLLHASLRKILGNHVTQKGSLVNEKKLRFDFSHNHPINEDNLIKIEKIVNNIIKKKYIVETELLDHEKAIKSGAMALFGEKYGDEVRVVSMGKNDDSSIFSRELCGGTHVKNTGEIGEFKLINQSSVASGVRRLEAVTSLYVNKYIKMENSKKLELDNITRKEIEKYKDLIKNLNLELKNELNTNLNLDEQLKNLKKIYLDKKNSIEIVNNNENIKIDSIGKIKFIYLLAKNYPSKLQKKFVDDQKKIYSDNSIILLISTNDNKISIILGLSEDLTNIFDATKLVTIASQIVGGKGGGGRVDLAQAGGNLISRVNDIYEVIKKEIKKLT